MSEVHDRVADPPHDVVCRIAFDVRDGADAVHGNAKLDSTAFASDFQITFLHNGGDNAPPVTAATVTGAYATVTSSVATQLAVPPSYTLDISNLRYAAVLTQKTISGANPTIQASELSVVASSILGSTQIRNIIVKRTSAGISAYQIFRVTFIS